MKHDGHLRGRSHVLGRVQSGADGAGRDRHEGGGMTLQEIAASIAELQANKRRAALENKPERCEGYQRAIDLLDKLAEMKRREQCQQQKTQARRRLRAHHGLHVGSRRMVRQTARKQMRNTEDGRGKSKGGEKT